jgi:hypothetical protein
VVLVSSLQDRFNQMTGKTRFGVCRIFLQLSGEIAPLLGVLNQASQTAVAADGDLPAVGESLVEICESLMRYQVNWQAAANEGDVLWDEGQASDYLTQLFTDSAQRYLSGAAIETQPDDALTLGISQNLVVMLELAFEGEEPALETSLTEVATLKAALSAVINLHYQKRLRAIQVHFSPASFADVLTPDQVLQNFAELNPL